MAGLERWKARHADGLAAAERPTCWWTRCAGAARSGTGSGSTCSTSPRPSARRRSRWKWTTTPGPGCGPSLSRRPPSPGCAGRPCSSRRSRPRGGPRSRSVPSGGPRASWRAAPGVRPEPDGQAGRVGGAERGGLGHHRAADRHAQDVGLELHGQVVGGHAAVDLEHVEADAGVLGHGLDHVAGLVAIASSVARARCALVLKRDRPTITPRASERQYGANRPEKAGTK